MPKAKQTKTDRPKAGVRATDRPERIPVSGQRNILGVSGMDKNRKYRFIKNVGANIEIYKRGGWDIVNKEDVIVDSIATVGTGSAVEVIGDRKTGEKLILVSIPLKFYEEDQAAKQALIDEEEEAMRQAPNQEGKYGDVKIGN